MFQKQSPKGVAKKDVFKNFATGLFAYYLDRAQIVDKNFSKSVKILISEKTVLSSIFYFEEVLFFTDQSIKMCWNGFY